MRPSTSSWSRVFNWCLLGISMPMLLTACGDSNPLCPLDSPRPAIRVYLYDSVGDTMLIGGGRGDISDGAYRDSLRATTLNMNHEPIGYTAGLGRAGVYVINVEREGFRAAVLRNVVVPDGSCGVFTKDVRIDMEPQ